MKVICNTDTLSTAAVSVQKAVMTKTSMPNLESIMFIADEKGLTMIGYDLEIGIETTIDANVIEEGSILINARSFVSMISHIPYEQTTIETDDKLQTRIHSGVIDYTITGLDTKDYPDLPVVLESKSIELKADVLKNMIKQTIFSAAQNDTRAVHRGLKFEIRSGEIRLVAIDIHRFAIRKEFIEYSGETVEFVVPTKTMTELVNLIGDSSDFIKIELGRRNIIFQIEGYKIVSRLLEGDFMNYNQVIPQDYSTSVRVKTLDLLKCVERVSIFCNDKMKAPMKCEFFGDQLSASVNTAMGSANDKIDVSIDGKDLTIGVQSRYIAEALKVVDCDEVLINMCEPLQPICIYPVDGDEFLYLILPVKLPD